MMVINLYSLYLIFTIGIHGASQFNYYSSNYNEIVDDHQVDISERRKERLLVSKLQEYVRIRTDHPKPKYNLAAEFLTHYIQEIGLEYEQFNCVQNKPIVIAKWTGVHPELKAVLLNSHMDVVAANQNEWIWDPFGASLQVDDHGYHILTGRGTQDVKSMGVLYLESIRTLISQGKTPNRNVYVMFLPDEEIGGLDGMQCFLKTDRFKDMNIGFSLDEGLANPSDTFKVFYGERVSWAIDVTAKGDTGHASRFIDNLATDKLLSFHSYMQDYRKQQKQKMELNPKLPIGNVSTINLTLMKFGTAINVVPDSAECSYDIRVTPNDDLKLLQSQLYQWAEYTNVSIHFREGTPIPIVTELRNNQWWNVLQKVAHLKKIQLDPEIYVGGSDSRYLRALGIPALGLNPFRYQPYLAHDHNESIRLRTLSEGYDFMIALIEALMNV